MRTSWIIGALLLTAPVLAGQGLLYPASGGGIPEGARPLELLLQDLDVHIRGGRARTVVTQVFRNQGPETIEGLYALPLPDLGSLVDFVVVRDGVRLASRIQEREEAGASYAEGRDAGAPTALLELEADHCFRGRVANIQAGTVIRTEVVLEEDLAIQGGVHRYRFPAWTATEEIPQAALLTATLTLDEGESIAEVASPTHPELRLITGADGRKVARLQAWEAALGRDLILYYRTTRSDFGLSLTCHRPEGEDWGHFALDLYFDRVPPDWSPSPRDVVFLVDTSASLRGERLRSLQAALREGIASLRGEDRFLLLPFSDHPRTSPAGLQPVNAGSLARAESALEELTGSGGTDLQLALETGLSLFSEPSREGLLVLLSDGVPTLGAPEVGDLLELVRDSRPESVRLAAFGLSNRDDEGLLESLARENGGAFAMAYEPENARAAAAVLFHRLAQPTIRDLTVELRSSSVEVADLLPPGALDLAMGYQRTLLGRYQGAGDAELVLRGVFDGCPDERALPLEFPIQEEQAGYVGRLWAQARVDQLLESIRRGAQEEILKPEIIELSRRYRFASPYTSFVVPRDASLSPGRIMPGDPEILIPAPPDARSVEAEIPFCGTKLLRFDPVRGLWVTRFLIPRDVEDGLYPVQIRILHRDGRLEELELGFTVDTSAPPITVKAVPPWAGPGERILVEVRPRVHLLDLMEVMLTSPPTDWVERARALGDVRTARAVLPDGSWVELTRTPREDVWRGEVELPLDWSEPWLTLVVVATDPAGNMTVEPIRMEVLS